MTDMTTPTLRDAQDLPALLPCPFCGKGPEKLEKQYGDESGYIRCRNCGAQSGRVFWTDEERESDDFSKSEAEAVAAWNRRAAIAAQPAPPVAQQGAEPMPRAADDWLRKKYGYARAHPEWRALTEAFNAGQACAAAHAQQPAALTDARILDIARTIPALDTCEDEWLNFARRLLHAAATQAPTTGEG